MKPVDMGENSADVTIFISSHGDARFSCSAEELILHWTRHAVHTSVAGVVSETHDAFSVKTREAVLKSTAMRSP